MTYNIKDGGIGRQQLILEVLQTIRPDIALLQEVMSSHIVQEFAQALNMHLLIAQGNSKRQIGLLSRFPISAGSSHHPFPPIWNAVLEASIEYAPHSHIGVFGLHLVPHPAWLLEWWRTWEIAVACHRLTLYSTHPCLVAGDFNAVAPNDHVVTDSVPKFLKLMLLLQGGRFFYTAIRRLESTGFTDCYRSVHRDENGFTLPTPAPTIRLDYAFANQILLKGLQSCDVVREPAVANHASDHYPVVAEFML